MYSEGTEENILMASEYLHTEHGEHVLLIHTYIEEDSSVLLGFSTVVQQLRVPVCSD
jgi:Holliday junction resolvasome RuvABC DNA-binding subunit